MTREQVYEVDVEFGDCDPARIVFFPNFLRWIDAASRHFFHACGLPPWHESERSHGIIGTPVVDLKVRFRAPASYGDHLRIRTCISAWGRTSFTMKHLVQRGDTVLVEAEEVRVFARREEAAVSAGEPPQTKLKAVPVPPEWRVLCA